MVSKRIKFIASLICSDDKVLDIGTDHALLPIFLIKNNMVSVADGSDISDQVITNAKNNVNINKLSTKINLFVSDGVKNIQTNKYNTFVITGMGFYTIKNILENADLSSINKMIIQSNNNYEDLRRFVNHHGYKIVKDYYIMDKNKTYLIIYLIKGKQVLSDTEYLCGLYDSSNVWYYEYVVNKNEKLLSKIPPEKGEKIKLEIELYNNYLTREKIEE